MSHPTSVITRSPLLKVLPDTPPRSSLLDALLLDQQTLTAVDRFSKRHDTSDLPAQSKYYRDLIPMERPLPGQQYAFEVDLDACTGCKACVAGCHSLNGLDEGEVWRTVGLLHGGTAAAPAQQTITTSCHHCLDPACMTGCPVKAYEKDPVTGIVRHLDDQCIGCQYCTLMCPYDAPKYSKKLGIVRKCDMCSSRLATGEAPACVQACPNEAIRIKVVDQHAAVLASESQTFLPGAPAPDHTLPTTRYTSKKPIPVGMLPADFYTINTEHSHPPLVTMLVLTQLAVGAFVVSLAETRTHPTSWEKGSFINSSFALALALAALIASTLHLGRPQLAWRAFLGLRTSWLSREILTFGAFAGLGVTYALSLFPHLARLPGAALLVSLRPMLGTMTAAAGVLGVFCSVMVYAATRRSHWRATITGFKFFATSALLGIAAVYAVSAAALDMSEGEGGFALAASGRLLLHALRWVALAKLAFEALAFTHLRDRLHSPLKRMALLMAQDLRGVALARFAMGLVGGVLIPTCLLGLRPGAAGGGVRFAALAMLLLLLAGELLERYLFFTAAPASRMPGGLS